MTDWKFGDVLKVKRGWYKAPEPGWDKRRVMVLDWKVYRIFYLTDEHGRQRITMAHPDAWELTDD